MPKNNERLSYTVDETSKVLGLGRVATYKAISEGVIPHIKIGKRILIPRAALDRWLENCGAMSGQNA